MRRLGSLALLCLLPLAACSDASGADSRPAASAPHVPTCTGSDTAKLRQGPEKPAIDAQVTGGWKPAARDTSDPGLACGSLVFDQAPRGWKYVSSTVTVSDGVESSSVTKHGLGGHENVAQLWTDDCVTVTANVRLTRTGGMRPGAVVTWSGTTQIAATCAG